jgi:hypothetical protein
VEGSRRDRDQLREATVTVTTEQSSGGAEVAASLAALPAQATGDPRVDEDGLASGIAIDDLTHHLVTEDPREVDGDTTGDDLEVGATQPHGANPNDRLTELW